MEVGQYLSFISQEESTNHLYKGSQPAHHAGVVSASETVFPLSPSSTRATVRGEDHLAGPCSVRLDA